jgi:hypothetical protein
MEQAELKQGIATILAEQISAKEQATLLTNAGLTIVEAARLEGVAPLLYWKLITDFKHVMLEEVWRGFECEFYSSLAYNQLQFGELKRVLPKLESQGIEVILLKGAALAHTCIQILRCAR